MLCGKAAVKKPILNPYPEGKDFNAQWQRYFNVQILFIV